MENKKIFELMDKFEKSSIDTFVLEDGEFALTLKKNRNVIASNQFKEVSNVMQNVIENNTHKETQKVEKLSGKVIKSPIVGTFYASSSPEKPPFVDIGSKVSVGDTVCIVEAMKMFNEVSTEFDGIVKEILVQNGENIEYGQPLIVLE